jgi:hypothetical protein
MRIGLEVRQNQLSSRSVYTQLIPGRGARPDLPDWYGRFHPQPSSRIAWYIKYDSYITPE